MELTDHLVELRKRLIYIVLILIVSFFGSYAIGELLQDLLLAPLRGSLGPDGKVVFLGLLDKVLTQFQLALWSSIIFSSPLWFHQIWLFIKPGLYPKEINVIRPFIFIGFLLFCSGVSFGYFIVFPYTFPTIMGFGIQGVAATINLKDYIVLSSKILVFLGVLFQMPNVMLILGFMGVVNKQSLKDARRYVIAGFAVVAAVMTPPDVITMMALWIPLVLLYEVGLLGVALIVTPYKKRKNAQEAKERNL